MTEVNDSREFREDKFSDAEEEQARRSFLRPLPVLIVGVVLAVALAFLVQFVITPSLTNRDAQNVLDGLKNSHGAITAVNTDMVTFQGQKIENANVKQKALAVGEVVTTPAGFVFGNGKSMPNAKVVEVYLDFSNQRSRDFLLMNQNSLRGMVENGTVILKVHPVPNGNAFTMYSAEAVAESFVTSPELSWDYMMELMRLAAVVKTDSADDVVGEISKTAKELGVPDVDANSIKNGTFASWIVSVGNDPRLKTGYYPPLVYVNGQILDGNRVNLNDAGALRREVLKR